jgi:hypothetical protein
VISELDLSGSSKSSGIEGTTTHGPPNVSPDSVLGSPSRKRSWAYHEEEEMSLFRRVRIKTEIRIPTQNPKQADDMLDDGDPLSDPQVRAQLEAEAELDGEHSDFDLSLLQQLEAENDVPGVDPHSDLELQLRLQAEDELETEPANEAEVEEALNRRRMMEETLYDSESEESD